MIWCLSSIVLLISVSFFFCAGIMEFYTFFCLSLTVGLDTFLILIAWKLSHINECLSISSPIEKHTAVKPIYAYSSCLRVFTSFLRFLGTSFTIHPSSTP